MSTLESIAGVVFFGFIFAVIVFSYRSTRQMTKSENIPQVSPVEFEVEADIGIRPHTARQKDAPRSRESDWALGVHHPLNGRRSPSSDNRQS